MKRKLLSVLTLSFACSAWFASAQITHETGKPASWTAMKTSVSDIASVKMPSFDVDAMLAEDAINDVEKIGPWRFGNPFTTSLSTENSGTWEELDNGQRIWRLAINSPGALSMNVIFDEYNLVPGDQVFIYNENRSDVIGPFTHLNNKAWNGLATLPITGETIIVELVQQQPAATQKSVLTIGQVTHGYRDIFGYAKRTYEKGLGDSGSCNNNVICPEGDPWRCQISSVGIIVVGGSGACTGTVLNNVAQDERPLFLSANHCGTNVTNWVFRFNWDSPTCSPTQNGPTNQSVSGATLLANNAGSDFSIMELSSAIPGAYNVYYSGWDASGVAPTNQTAIHHPSGDVKKISFDNQAASQATFGGAACWNISNWEDGTTEPGSSGSGLWDQNQRLIGQLYGGSASCSSISDDYYGRLDVSWDGGSAAVRLRDHLDPGNTGTLVLDGLGTGACAGVVVDYDAATQAINGIDASYCNQSSITPTMTLKNNGNVTLTSVDIDYDFNTGGSTGTIPWTGSLASGATEVVNLPTFNLAGGTNTLTVSTSQPNGTTDLNTSNDASTSTFNAVMNGVIVTVDIIQDQYGSETTWEIQDAGGTVLYSGGPYADGNDQSLETADVCLELSECYDFIIYDSYGDGICCGFGNGSYTVGNSGVVYASGGLFTDQESTNFCVTLDIDEEALAGVQIYPNPTSGEVTIDLSDVAGGNAEVQVYSAFGTVVAQHTFGENGVHQFDLSKEANGLYFVEVKTDAGTAVRKLNLNK